MRQSLRIAGICALLVTAVSARETEINNGHEVVARQAIVSLDLSRANQSLPAVLAQLTALTSADDLRPLQAASHTYLLHSKSGNVTALLAILKNHPAVVFAEPDYVVKAVATPNDPGFSSQWSLLNAAGPGADIGATLAWNVSTGSTANVIGVVDTGIDYTHPDLAANVWSAPTAFTVKLSWGSITCPAGSHGYNAVARTCDPADDHYHGTHVSGTIGAAGNNGLGVSGVNWTARLMGLKFLDSTGNGSVSDAIDAIEFGLQTKNIFGSSANLRVLSNSWGGSGYSQALLNEINGANTAEVLFVAAAGNSSANIDNSPTYPASYTAANLITVAATTNNDGLASFSNYGPTKVHLGAPGDSILSTVPGAAYAYASGTSMATPHVAGAAILVLSKCALNTAALRTVLFANVDPDSALLGRTVTGGRLNVNRAIRSCAAVGPTGAAAFVRADAVTSGNWKSGYGADGYNVINDSATYPSYVTVAPSSNGNYTWTASTSDPRAPQKGASADRIAACWVSQTSFNIDFNFTDANPHQVALYFLDWDGFGGGRTQRVEILDNNGTVLDSRSISGFTGGLYLVWNLNGRVTARITNTNSAGNAIVNAIFFGGAPAVNFTGTAAFLRADTSTAGSWRGVYGADGYNVINDAASYPSYAAVTPSGNGSYTWAASTTDIRATRKASSATDRLAACWVNQSSFDVALQFTDSNTHQVALYLLDWDGFGGGRTERVDVLDANGNLLDTRSATGFMGGLYFIWNLSGRVTFRITNTNGAGNAVISAIFFGGAAPTKGTAAFVKTDAVTSGSWKGVYGADGYHIFNDAFNYPAFATVTPSGNGTYTWVASTTDPRATQKASAADRLAACWVTQTSFDITLAFNDPASHPVALYLLDWDNFGGGRTQRIDILDPDGNLLDSRSVSNFSGGLYLVWNFSGSVTVRITNTNPNANAVVSALLFR